MRAIQAMLILGDYIETLNEWSQWKNKLSHQMFTK